MGLRGCFGIVGTALLAIVGCSASPQTSASAPPLSASAPSTGSGPISAVVDQFRDGYASGTIVLQLDNVTSADVTVTRAELVDPRFTDGTAWTGTTVLSQGYPISLPAVTTVPRCGVPDDGVPAVRLTLAERRTLVVSASDPHHVLPRVHAQMCIALRVSATAALRFEDSLTPGPSAGTATLELIAGAPKAPGHGEELTLVSVAGTTLLDEDPAAPWPKNQRIVPGGPPIPITVRPARCDPHAVAEDKVGTLIPLAIDVGGTRGTVSVAASDALRTAVYAFVARSCGWPASP